jgi:hypothetical protein
MDEQGLFAFNHTPLNKHLAQLFQNTVGRIAAHVSLIQIGIAAQGGQKHIRSEQAVRLEMYGFRRHFFKKSD